MEGGCIDVMQLLYCTLPVYFTTKQIKNINKYYVLRHFNFIQYCTQYPYKGVSTCNGRVSFTTVIQSAPDTSYFPQGSIVYKIPTQLGEKLNQKKKTRNRKSLHCNETQIHVIHTYGTCNLSPGVQLNPTTHVRYTSLFTIACSPKVQSFRFQSLVQIFPTRHTLSWCIAWIGSI